MEIEATEGPTKTDFGESLGETLGETLGESLGAKSELVWMRDYVTIALNAEASSETCRRVVRIFC
jgi:hypothetical protein